MEAMRQRGNAVGGMESLAPAPGDRRSTVDGTRELSGDGADRVGIAAEIDRLDHSLLEAFGARQAPESGVQGVRRAWRRRDRAAISYLVICPQERRVAASLRRAQHDFRIACLQSEEKEIREQRSRRDGGAGAVRHRGLPGGRSPRLLDARPVADRDGRQPHDAAIALVAHRHRDIERANALEILESPARPDTDADGLSAAAILAEPVPAQKAFQQIAFIEAAEREEGFGKTDRHCRIVRPFAGREPVRAARGEIGKARIAIPLAPFDRGAQRVADRQTEQGAERTVERHIVSHVNHRHHCRLRHQSYFLAGAILSQPYSCECRYTRIMHSHSGGCPWSTLPICAPRPRGFANGPSGKISPMPRKSSGNSPPYATALPTKSRTVCPRDEGLATRESSGFIGQLAPPRPAVQPPL